MSEDVIFSQQQHVGIITLNRPKALNALTFEMITQIHQQLSIWKDDLAIQAVVIRSAGGKAFCAGGDVRGLYEMGRQRSLEQMNFFEKEYGLNQMIHHYPKPYIALMDGITMGGGVGIALHGSHPVASSSFVFAMPETTIGFFPDVGASYLLTRCPGKMGIYLGLTGNRLQANEACALGLVKYVIEPTAFEDVVEALLHMDLSCDAYVKVSACLDSFQTYTHSNLLADLQVNVDAAFAHKDVISLMENLKSHDEVWYREVTHTLEQKSPLSLCVTFEQFNRAAHMSFDECIQMDFCLAQHFMNDNDFYEGVRALLIDKDKTPQWSPKALSLIETSLVEGYFT